MINTYNIISRLVRIFYLILFPIYSNVALAVAPIEESVIDTHHKYVVLSIDGGGVRGIIPARILQEIEQRTGKPIYQLVDMISGNSTGGLISLALVTPAETSNNVQDDIAKTARYTAQDLVELYKNRSSEIFDRSTLWKIRTGMGVWGAKYDRSNLDNILSEMFKNVLLSDTLKPAMVLSYSLSEGEPHFWTTRIAKTSDKHDFFLKDIAAATSAAPTYFAPKEVVNKDGSSKSYEADGGIFANDPASAAISEMYRAFPNIDRNDILLISIGSGKVKLTSPINSVKDSGVIGWVLKANLIDVMMGASSYISDWESSILVNANEIRLQIDIDPKFGALDNTNQNNLKALLAATEEYIEKNTHIIDDICKKLLEHFQNPILY